MVKDVNSEWKILMTEEFVKNAEKLGVYDRVLGFLNDLAEELNRSPRHTLEYFEKQPRIARIDDKVLRRIRMGRYRMFYYMDHRDKKIVFIDIRLRKETHKTYRF